MFGSIYTEDHEAFRDSVREFIKREIAPRDDDFREQRCIDREVWIAAGRQGLLGLEIPESYGGSAAGDFRYNAVLVQELSAVAAAYSSSFGIHVDVVAPYLVELGTEELKQRILPGFCTGEIVTAIGMTEAGGGSDLAALKTSAVRDGDDWIINGSKTFITNGYNCDLVVVAAQTDPSKRSRGITLFAVEAGMPGFERGRKLDKVGQPESDTAEMFFDNVRVPSENLIGEVGRGFRAMMERLPQERVGSAISNIAHAAAVLQETLEYAKERKAFGQSIGSFQHNKFLLAELVTKVEMTQSWVDQAVLAHAKGELSAVDAAKVKWWSAQVQNEVLDHCVQIHGGYGYMREYDVERALRDARLGPIGGGTDEIMKEIIGKQLGL